MNQQTAHDVLSKHWDGLLPVNPAAIAKAMGITLIADPFFTHSGHYSFNDGKPVITYNASEFKPRKRFTIAHEIGHHVHGDIDAPRDNSETFSARSSSPIEVAANQFAAALLMPAAVVRHLVLEKEVTSLDRLAEIFGVSTVAMRFRLQNLGLI